MTVPPEVLALLASWRGVPAFVRDARLDVVASNPLARAVSAAFSPGVNLVRFTFLNQWTEDATREWSEVSAQVVAILRGAIDARPGDDALRDLVGELSVGSEQFSSLWAAPGGRVSTVGTITIEHPIVGALPLTYQALAIPATPDLSLVIWTAATAEAQAALDLLIEVTERDG
ncbi:hypothetical protein BH09ACT5_BH09ACT5_00180 [soil metagenome]